MKNKYQELLLRFSFVAKYSYFSTVAQRAHTYDSYCVAFASRLRSVFAFWMLRSACLLLCIIDTMPCHAIKLDLSTVLWLHDRNNSNIYVSFVTPLIQQKCAHGGNKSSVLFFLRCLFWVKLFTPVIIWRRKPQTLMWNGKLMQQYKEYHETFCGLQLRTLKNVFFGQRKNYLMKF